MLRTQEPLSWRRLTIGAREVSFHEKGSSSQQFLKLQGEHCLDFYFFLLNPLFFLKSFFSGPPGSQQPSDACFVPLAPTTYSSLFP